MPRMTAAEREAREAAHAALVYAVSTADEPLDREGIATALPPEVAEKITDDVFDEVLAELVAAGTVLDDDGEYSYVNPDELDDDERVTIADLPVRDGFGYIVIEAPIDLVYAYATLHPAEQATMSASSAGALRHMLVEQGKMRNGRPVPVDDLPTHAVVAPEVA